MSKNGSSQKNINSLRDKTGNKRIFAEDQG